jgi:hypothetical protein
MVVCACAILLLLWTTDSGHINKRTVGVLRRDLMELQCTEEKLQTLLKVVEGPLERLGNNRPASSISDISDFGSLVIKCFIVCWFATC